MSTMEGNPLPQLDPGAPPLAGGVPPRDVVVAKTPEDLERLYDVPVTVSAVLGHARLPIGELLKIGPGSLLELDRKVGEAIDIRVNDRLVARGEVVLVDDRLGVTMTEIVIPTT
jgi:flagellar motor switch protein FliN/FliY